MVPRYGMGRGHEQNLFDRHQARTTNEINDERDEHRSTDRSTYVPRCSKGRSRDCRKVPHRDRHTFLVRTAQRGALVDAPRKRRCAFRPSQSHPLLQSLHLLHALQPATSNNERTRETKQNKTHGALNSVKKNGECVFRKLPANTRCFFANKQTNSSEINDSTNASASLGMRMRWIFGGTRTHMDMAPGIYSLMGIQCSAVCYWLRW